LQSVSQRTCPCQMSYVACCEHLNLRRDRDGFTVCLAWRFGSPPGSGPAATLKSSCRCLLRAERFQVASRQGRDTFRFGTGLRQMSGLSRCPCCAQQVVLAASCDGNRPGQHHLTDPPLLTWTLGETRVSRYYLSQNIGRRSPWSVSGCYATVGIVSRAMAAQTASQWKPLPHKRRRDWLQEVAEASSVPHHLGVAREGTLDRVWDETYGHRCKA
jgi:hypothetical protein